MVKSCYIHIPFCNSICSYCDFCKVFYNEKFISKYLDSLEKEISLNYKGEVLDTLYIGGGTPSALPLTELQRLFQILSKLKLSKNIEYTIESNFDSVTKDKLTLYKKYGINRLSFGVESIDENNLLFLERKLDKRYVLEIVEFAKSIGFNNINVDLIYAIPNETIDTLKKDLEFILDLDIPHISTYSLMIEKNTKLEIKGIKNISEDLDFSMYQEICKTLKNNDYKHYEISNFAKEGYYSRHNTCYWNNDYYYGFGVGASSYLANTRKTNTKSITKYIENKYISSQEILSIGDIIEYEVILGLRKSTGIDLTLFRKKYKKDLLNVYDYTELVDAKLLLINNNHLYIPEEKWYISNEIIVRLLGCEVK